MEKISTDSDIPEENLRAKRQADWENQHMPSVINLMIDTVFNFGKSKTPASEGYTSYVGANLDV